MFLLVILFFPFICSTNFTIDCFNFYQDILIRSDVDVSYVDVLLSIDTKTHFETDELDCANFHIMELTEVNGTGIVNKPIQFYFESGCGKSTHTNVWVSMSVLKVNETRNLRVYYGNRETREKCKNLMQPAPNRAEFNGSFIVMVASAACPEGWSDEVRMKDGHFPVYLASEEAGYYDSTENYNHSHPTDKWSTDVQPVTELHSSDSGGSSCNVNDDYSGHRLTFTPSYEMNVVPYLDLAFCKRNTLDIKQNTVIAIESHMGYNQSSSLVRFEELDGKFPRRGTYPNSGGGSNAHTHSWGVFTTSGASQLRNPPFPGATDNNTFAEYGHVHTIQAGISEDSNEYYPPHSTLLFAKSTFDGDFNEINNEMIFFADNVPPKGWNVEKKYANGYIRGSNNGMVELGFGGPNHNHGVTIKFDPHVGPTRYCLTGAWSRAGPSHNHVDEIGNFDTSVSNALPHVSFSHIKRKNPKNQIEIQYSDVVRFEEKEDEFDLMFYIYLGAGALLLVLAVCLVCLIVCCCLFCFCICLSRRKKHGTLSKERASGFNALLKSIDEIKEDELLEMSDGKPKSFKSKRPNQKEITIDFNEIDTGVKIHQSFLSSYYESEWNNKKVLYRFFDHNVIQEEDFPKMREEMNVIRGIKHNSVLQFHGFTSLPNAGVVCEYIPKSLKNHIIKTQNLEFKAKVKIIKQIAMLMFFLQGKGIVNHLSIDSIFVNEKNEVKIAIEFAKSLKKFFTKEYICNNRYSSPELVDHVNKEGLDRKELREEHRKLLKQKMQSKIGGKKEDLFKREVYSFGILMFEVVTGSFDYYKGKSEKELREPPKLKKEKYFANWFVNLYKMCLKESPQERPNFERICQILENIPK